MGDAFPVRRNSRISTHLPASLESAGRRLPVIVQTLSAGGFYCTGQDLEDVGGRVRLHFVLDPAGPSWSPTEQVELLPCRGGDDGPCRLSVDAEVLYLDLGERDPFGAPGGLGARFVDLEARQLAALRDHVGREAFRSHDGRTRGGAVAAPRALGASFVPMAPPPPR